MRRPITQQIYDGLVAGYRESPGNASHAAKIAGCDRRMAKRGWDTGWIYMKDKKGNTKYPWAPPIRDLLMRERGEARAKALEAEALIRQQDAAKRKEQRDAAIKTIADESRGVSFARANAIGLSRIVGSTIVAAMPVVERLKASLETSTLDPKSTMRILSSISYMLRQSNEAIRLAIELERTRVGDPNSVLTDNPGLDNVTPQEAANELSRLERSLERAKKLGLVVMEGGDALPETAEG